MFAEKISVIVPVYNVEKYLHKCINSILDQTYRNLEIILIDDGSTDNSGKICDEYALKDERIKVIHKENGGLSSARNAGLDICSGDYIGFVDSDDYIAEDMYEYLYVNLIKNNADIAMCNYFSVSENRKITKVLKIKTFVTNKKEDILKENLNYAFNAYPAVWNKLFKKYIFLKLRFPNGKCCEDNFILLESIDKLNRYIYLEQAKYYYLNRNNSLAHRKIDNHLFDEVEVFSSILQYVLKMYPKLKKYAEKCLLISYKISLDRLLYNSNKDEYVKEKIICQKNIKKLFFSNLLKNSLSIHQKIICALIVINYKIYFRVKNEFIKKYYFNG